MIINDTEKQQILTVKPATLDFFICKIIETINQLPKQLAINFLLSDISAIRLIVAALVNIHLAWP